MKLQLEAYLLLSAILISVCPALAQVDLQTHGTATQSSEWNVNLYPAPKGIDGDPNTFSHTLNWDASWWQLELDQAFTIDRINITNRNHATWAPRMEGLNLRVYNAADQLVHESVLTNPGAGGTLNFDFADIEVKRIWIGLDPGELNGKGDSIVTIAELELLEEYIPPPTDPLPPVVINDPVRVAQYDDAVVVYLEGFDIARAQYPNLQLQYRMILADGTLGTGRTFDLTKPWEKPSIIIRKDGAEYSGILLSASSDASVFFRRLYPLNGTVSAPTLAPTAGSAVVELGQFVSEAPTIPLLDRTQFDDIDVNAATFGVSIEGSGLQVKSDINYPQVSSGQLAALSRQTDFPNDSAKRSLYIPLKSQLFDQATGQPDGVAHYLCEVPLDPNWLTGSDDLAVNLDTNQIKVHRTDLVDPSDGRNILGTGGGGLGQGTGTMAVDADGNIYFSNSVPTDVVRFNVHTSAFEMPPVDPLTITNNFLPTDDDILGDGGTDKNGRWQTYRMVASMNHSVPSRMLFGRTISRLIFNGTLYEWSALFTLPTDWSDPVAFENDFQLLVGSWPTAQHSFYDTLPETGGALRRIQYFKSYGNTVYAQPYPQSIGGPWRVDVAADNTVEAFGTPETMADYSDGTNKPVDALPYNAAAGGRIHFNDYGLLTMDRDDLYYCLTGMTDNSLTGQIEVSYDAIAYMIENEDDFTVLLENMGGPSLAPSYMATYVPGQPDKVMGVGEYGYYLAEFDTSEATPGEIQKEFLDFDSPNPTLELPLKVGLGPYGYQWAKIDGDDWLYVGGYTGLTRMKYSENGVPLDRFTMHEFHTDLNEVRLDAGGYGAIKRFRWLQHGLDDRFFVSGTHSAARAGTAYSGGLLSFHQTDLDTMWKLSYMSRSFWTVRMRNRVFRDVDGVPVQEFIASSFFDDQYALTIPSEQVPTNTDPKLFMWDYKSGGQMRDLMGFTQAELDGSKGITDIDYSNDRRYMIILQGNQLLTFDPQTNRFIDGKTLNYGNGIRIASYSRPDYSFMRAPDDSLFLNLRTSDASSNALFLKIHVSPTGALSVEPYYELHALDSATIDDIFCVQHAFLPDYTNADGSYDLFLGAHTATSGGGTVSHVIKDFIPARSHSLDRMLNILSTGIGGAPITGDKPGATPYSAVCTDGQSVSITATSPPGSLFEEWQDEDGNTISVSSTLAIDMTVDRSVTAVFGPAPIVTDLVISEIHYHPAAASVEEAAAGFGNRDQFEFIELMNIGATPINLSAMAFTQGIAFDFSTSAIQTIAPGARILLVADSAAFAERYGTQQLPKVAGEFTGDLADDGEMIVLKDGAATILSFNYSNLSPWPESPGGGDGFSLVLINPTQQPPADHNDPFNWRGSASSGGAPGASDASTFGTWASGFGLSANQPNLDSDLDGRSNLREYLEGTDPLTPDWANGLNASIETIEVDSVSNSYLVFRVRGRVGVDDVDVAFDQSADLQSWAALPTVFLRRERIGNSQIEWLVYRSTSPALASKLFARSRAELR